MRIKTTRNVTDLIVHCTATAPNWRAGESLASKIDEVRRWHVEDNGWRDIGYHFLIDRDGNVGAGRPLDQVGAHCRGHNRGSIGVSLLGGHGGETHDAFDQSFTAAQDAALRRLIGNLQEANGPLRLSGHNEYAAKACPCFDVRRWFDAKPARRKRNSKTLQSAGLSGAVGAVGAATAAVARLEPLVQAILVGGGLVVLLAALVVCRERLKHWARGVC